MIKSIAFIRATGDQQFDKVVGQVRHGLDSLFTILIAFGLLSRFGLEIDPTSWAAFLNGLTSVAENVFMIIGTIGKLIVQASSWYSKEV